MSSVWVRADANLDKTKNIRPHLFLLCDYTFFRNNQVEETYLTDL